jgi:hypothetical protein
LPLSSICKLYLPYFHNLKKFRPNTSPPHLLNSGRAVVPQAVLLRSSGEGNMKMNNTNAENTQQISQPVLEMSARVADLQREVAALAALKPKKGPSTPEAKQRVKYNALRHGFTGQVLIMTPEEREHFDAFVKGMMTDLAPINTHETFLANSMAEEAWRLNQIRARCANLAAVGDIDGAGNKYRPMDAEDSEIETAGSTP